MATQKSSAMLPVILLLCGIWTLAKLSPFAWA